MKEISLKPGEIFRLKGEDGGLLYEVSVAPDPHNIDAIQNRLSEWAKATFEGRDFKSVMDKLKEEIAEMWESSEPEEFADCIILMLDAIGFLGLTASAVITTKMKVNESRTYSKGPNGVFRHDS